MPNGFLNFTISFGGRVEFERNFPGRIDRVGNLRPFFEQLADGFGELEREAFRCHPRLVASGRYCRRGNGHPLRQVSAEARLQT